MKLKRERKDKWSIGIDKFRPNVVLNGEENPKDESIECITESDSRKGLDLVLVVGTYFRVPGARRLARGFCYAAKIRGGMTV